MRLFLLRIGLSPCANSRTQKGSGADEATFAFDDEWPFAGRAIV